MNAEPVVALVTRALVARRLDVVLIGNAAAALPGAPVTTLDFDVMSRVDGVSSFEALRARATTATFGGAERHVAALEDIIRRKPAANRPQDRAALPFSMRRSAKSVRQRPARRPSREPSALRRETDRALVEQIRRPLALPMEQRTHFPRVRLPGGGSAR